MQIITLYDIGLSPDFDSPEILRFASCNKLTAGILFNQLYRSCDVTKDRRRFIVAPSQWPLPADSDKYNVKNCDLNDFSRLSDGVTDFKWLIISDGRFVTRINKELLDVLLANEEADVITVNAKSDLLSYRERVLFASKGQIAGFRRLYSDLAEPSFSGYKWPNHMFIRSEYAQRLIFDQPLPSSFGEFKKRCSQLSIKVSAFNVAGSTYNLNKENHLLRFLMSDANSSCGKSLVSDITQLKPCGSNCRIDKTARISEDVILGDNVYLGSDVVVLGPAIICDNTTISHKVVIDSAIIGPAVTIDKNSFVRGRVIFDSTDIGKIDPLNAGGLDGFNLNDSVDISVKKKPFHCWPHFSYARCFKRLFDICGALLALALFLPIMPLIALAIKLNSSGPVFFKARRQGLHGRAFNCIKFRSMVVGADDIQEKLRVVNQIDGPQFKMDDDPRVSLVGQFLRDTYLDEIPQFFNVLCGHMSLVGPRPSPERENTRCPYWRDLRLSVRPGITGLWQIFRTREPLKDFQEWIYFDTQYIKNISFKNDVKICWQTFKKMVDKFIEKF